MSQDSELKKTKILWFGDLVHPSGFGRIGNEVTGRLAQRGWHLVGASIPWGGYPWNMLPYPVFGMGGQDIWNRLTAMAQSEQPDVIVVCQDFPYAQTTFHGCRIDWSKTKLIIVTPIDGAPVHPEWLRMVDLADATMVISQFGVEVLRMAGKQVGLLHPGVNAPEFYPAESKEEVIAYRAQMDIPPDAFVIGAFMMNQGRKMVSATLAAFREFAMDKPEALLYLDMDKISAAGWDIPSLLTQSAVNPDRVKFREDALAAGLMELRQRFLLCDMTSQLAHREGFGLPNLESMACKVPPTVLDWCSGAEIAGGGRGILVRRIAYMENGTWGGARDAFPDMPHLLSQWNRLYKDRDELAAIAQTGYKWATEQTWDVAADQFESVLKQVVSQQQKERANEPESYFVPAPGLSDNGASRVGDSASLQQLTEGLPVPAIADADGKPVTG